ncbi:MAG: maleylpyruvate isomerase N-terminal domain-containing protein [Actinobacteria bacterium]|nr:maleylpyruvate isomerase N-terminal domain-containing protein [Actinomycetota bacterium]
MSEEPRPAERRYRLLDSARVGIAAIERIAETVTDWQVPTPCTRWDAHTLVRHLHAIAADYLQWADDAPADRTRPLLRSAELAYHNEQAMVRLPLLPARTHLQVFSGHANRHLQLADRHWDWPMMLAPSAVWTVGQHVGVAAIEWHVHAWDLARSQGTDHRPGDTEVLADVWRARLEGPTGQPLDGDHDTWEAVLIASGRDPSWQSA